MMLLNLNRVFSRTNLVLGMFEEKTGGYTAVLAGCLEHAAWIEGQLTTNDMAMVEMQVYLGDYAGARFPQGHGETPIEALEKLDQILALVPDTDAGDWSVSVCEAYDSMFDAERKHGAPYHIAVTRDAGELHQVN